METEVTEMDYIDLTIEQYCSLRGISRRTFYYNKKKYNLHFHKKKVNGDKKEKSYIRIYKKEFKEDKILNIFREKEKEVLFNSNFHIDFENLVYYEK